MGRRTNSRFVFTKASLEALPAPERREAWYYDKTTRGLALCVTAKGAKTLYLVKWQLTNTVRFRLGMLGEISIADARGEVVRLAGLMMSGWNPQEAKREARKEATLQDLWDWWLADAKRRKKTWREDERLWNKFLSAWKARRLSAIHTRDVAALHAKIGDENGRYQANRVLALLRAAFRRADKIGWKGDDPTKGVQAFPERQRERFLDGAELKRLFTVLDAEPQPARDFFYLALLTGARRGNLQAMRWEDINLASGLWRIPGEVSKNGHQVLVPLVPAAVDILRARAEDRDGSEWVFASRGETGHLIEPKGAWKRIRKAAAIEDVRIHDLRRTLGSWQAAGGSSLPIIGRSLGHSDGSPATAVYARLSLDPVRESVSKAAAAMLALAAPTEEKEITSDG